MRKAADLNPASSDLFYDLARAEEAVFKYYDAQKDYERALALSNQNGAIRASYERFKIKVAAGLKNSAASQ